MAGAGYLVICLSFGLATGIIGRSKGSSFFLWFMIGAIVPFAGMAAAMLYRVERDELRRECPTCGAILKLYEQVCTRCGTDLEFPEFAIAPESASRRR